MKYISNISIILLLATCLFSCNDYLDEQPRKGNGVELKTFEQLEAILSGRAETINQSFDDWGTARRYMSDCYELPVNEMYVAAFTMMGDYETFRLNCFQPQYTDNIKDAPSLWKFGFKSIFLANIVFDYIDKVTGGTDAQREELLRRAHFLRAYNYYELANCYCVPYCEANLNELGLPIVTSTAYREDYTRASLKDVYDFIESDLKQALNLSIPLVENGTRKVWRENIVAANGFAARFYLNKGDYEKAAIYADKALSLNTDVADYTNEGEFYMSEIEDMMQQPQTVSSWWESCIYDMTGMFASQSQRSYYKHLCYSSSFAIPSPKLISSFNKEYDMRYKLFYYQDYSSLSFTFFGSYAFGGTTIEGYSYFHGDGFDAGPSAAEMYLIKAECMARQGQWSNALADLNTHFRPYRIAKDAPADVRNLSAANQQEAIDVILKERMLEFPFTLRWMDIRRCNFNNDPNDDVTITRTYYKLDPNGVNDPITSEAPVTYTLSPTSNKYVYTMAIPSSEMETSNGTIQQNPYE